MKIELIAFSKNGCSLAERIATELSAQNHHCETYRKGNFVADCQATAITSSLHSWTEEAFAAAEALVFVGAVGIAVRAIAPFVANKTQDPAVVVVDEKGKYAISLLSGHIGGANKLTTTIAAAIGAEAVITTATDINGKFAVDAFAEERGLYISNMTQAKEISAAILARGSVSFQSDFPVNGQLPDGLTYAAEGELGVYISSTELKKPFRKTLHLIPKTITVGIGCRKDTPCEQIEELVIKVLRSNELSLHSVKAVASIDLKKNEEGILQFCKKYELPPSFYTKEELEEVKGDFSESSFVKNITGIGNVCERAALKVANEGTLIQKKVAANGVTVALASEPYQIYF